MYCIEATTATDREIMKKRDMALELIRMKRNIPVMATTGDDTVYSSATEAAECLGIRPQIISRQVQRAREGKPARFKEVLEWEPYTDLMICGDVNEYVLHYIRLYYPDLYESSLHVVDADSVAEHEKMCEVLGMDQVIEIRDGWYYDLVTDEKIRRV